MLNRTVERRLCRGKDSRLVDRRGAKIEERRAFARIVADESRLNMNMSDLSKFEGTMYVPPARICPV
jgi:hypothetical protein